MGTRSQAMQSAAHSLSRCRCLRPPELLPVPPTTTHTRACATMSQRPTRKVDHIFSFIPKHEGSPKIGNALVFAGSSHSRGIVSPDTLGRVALEKGQHENQWDRVTEVKLILRLLVTLGDGLPSVPWIKGAAGIALEIVNTVDTARSNKGACQSLALRVYQVIETINKQAQGGHDDLQTNVEELEWDLWAILQTIRSLASCRTYTQILKGEAIKQDIADCEAKLVHCENLFFMKTQMQTHQMTGKITEYLKMNQPAMGIIPVAQASTSVQVIRNFGPPSANVFVGRDDLVAEGVSHIESISAARIAILGQGGIGKTALSLAIFHHEKVGEIFGKKAFFISCESLSTGLDLVSDILLALGSSGSGEKDILGMLSNSLLSAGRLLLVLDNFETLWPDYLNSQVQQVLEVLDSIQTLTLILTMRGDTAIPLAGINWKFLPSAGLDVLSLNAGKEMYNKLQINSLNVDPATLHDLEKLIKELDCVPLAISLVAALGNMYSPTMLYQRWTKISTKMLKRTGEAPSRTTSIEISITLSLESKTVIVCPEAIRLLNLLAFLPEGIPHWKDLLECFTPLFQDAHDAAIALRTVALAYQTATKALTLLSPTRHYIKAQIQADNEDHVNDQKALLDFVNQLVIAKSAILISMGLPNIAQIFSYALTRDPSEENVRNALECAVWIHKQGVKNTQLVIQIVPVCRKLGIPMLDIKALLHYSEVLENLHSWNNSYQEAEVALKVSQSIGAQLEIAKCFNILGNLDRMLDRYSGAVDKQHAAYEIFVELQHQHGQAKALDCLGDTLRMQGKYSEAVDKHHAAYEIFVELQDQLGQANTLQGLGNALTMQGKYSESVDKHHAAYEIFVELQHQHGQAKTLDCLGDTLRMQGKYSEAVDKHYAAYKIFVELQDQLGQANALQGLGNVLRMQGKYSEAVDKHYAAYGIFVELQHQHGQASALQSLGDALTMQDKYSEAVDMHHTAYEIFVELQNQLGQANTLQGLGNALTMQGKYSESVDKHHAAYKILVELQHQHGQANTLDCLGDALRMQGKYSEAVDKHYAAYEIFVELQDQLGQANALQSLGNSLTMQEKYSEAVDMHHTAYEIFVEVQDQLGQANALQSLGDALTMQEKYSEAVDMHHTAYEIFVDLQNQLGQANTLQGLGLSLESLQRYSDAIEKYTAAQALYSSLQRQHDMTITSQFLHRCVKLSYNIKN